MGRLREVDGRTSGSLWGTRVLNSTQYALHIPGYGICQMVFKECDENNTWSRVIKYSKKIAKEKPKIVKSQKCLFYKDNSGQRVSVQSRAVSEPFVVQLCLLEDLSSDSLPTLLDLTPDQTSFLGHDTLNLQVECGRDRSVIRDVDFVAFVVKGRDFVTSISTYTHED